MSRVQVRNAKAPTDTQDARALTRRGFPIQQVVEYHRHEDEVGAAVGQGQSLRWRQPEFHTAVGRLCPCYRKHASRGLDADHLGSKPIG